MQKIDVKANRQFAIVMTIGCFIFGSLIPLIKRKNVHSWLNLIAFTVLIVGIFWPRFLDRPRLIWLKIGNILGKINTNIIFTFIYLSLFSFIHFIQFVFGRDRLKKRFKKYQSTFDLKDKISSFNDPF